ncbi:homeodomain-interacting protein kinase 3-like isoform X1 [Cottoperca gobio]|uniref:Homeodomain-interacting protein kinase 3-like isoform X1 n=1 Tax=Cottoperca gobio TaxID=56716 RepID=A0A6J2PD44_COTGO|nr:homeodomain-interacting protein kinase 3-like isoform X1 [Cottoperca gobio]
MYRSASWPSSSSETRLHHQLPRGHTYLDTLRHVSFGTVVMCKRRDAGQIVDVKTSDHHQDLHQEASMLRHLMLHNLDKCNIITLYDEIFISNRMSLVVEKLDISLHDYLLETQGLVLLEDIRTVIQQMATALAALKRVGVIHGDVTTDNIMMVDRVRQPFRVKLIDFSQAMFSSQAKPGRILQTPQYRAAEIMLGLPFCEAVDIWALGCVMGIMMFGFELFPTTTDYDALLFIIDLLGPPPQHLMKAAQKSKVCFKKTDCGQWRLKTPEEYWGPDLSSHDDRKYTFRSLDEGKMVGV